MAQNFRNDLQSAVGTVAQTLVTGADYDAVIGIRCCNILTSTIEVDVYITNSGNKYLAKGVVIPPNSAIELIQGGAKIVLKNGLPDGVALNVNIPAVPYSKIKGVSITRQGKSRVIETFDKRVDPRKNTYYWYAGEMRIDDVDEEADCFQVSNNYISITPIHFDLTSYKAIDELKNWDIPL